MKTANVVPDFLNDNEILQYIQQKISFSGLHFSLDSCESSTLLRLKNEYPDLYKSVAIKACRQNAKFFAGREALQQDSGDDNECNPAIRRKLFSDIKNGASVAKIKFSSLPDFSGNNISDLYAIKVTGDSMINACINDGDTLIYRTCYSTPPSGSIVVVGVNGIFFVKRLIFDANNEILLCSENPDPHFKPFPVTADIDLRILGKVVSVIHGINQ